MLYFTVGFDCWHIFPESDSDFSLLSNLKCCMLMLINVLTEVYISVLQLSYDLTWQKLKEKFSHCGMSFAQYELYLHCLINKSVTGLTFMNTL